MTNDTETDEPRINPKEFRHGDIIANHIFGRLEYGVISNIPEVENQILVLKLLDGKKDHVNIPLECLDFRKATQEEAVDWFRKLSKDLESRFEQGGLYGALSARIQYFFDEIIRRTEEGENLSKIAWNLPETPKTGVYVLNGLYFGRESEYLEGLASTPRLSEKNISRVLMEIQPYGFGNIPSASLWNGHKLSGYKVYEIPKKAICLVKDPKKLEIHLKAD